VNIVSRLKEGEWGEKQAEGYGVGTATLWDINISAEWILMFVSFPAREDGSCAEQILRRTSIGKVGDAVGKLFLQKRSQNQTPPWSVLCEKRLFFQVIKYIKGVC